MALASDACFMFIGFSPALLQMARPVLFDSPPAHFGEPELQKDPSSMENSLVGYCDLRRIRFYERGRPKLCAVNNPPKA